MGTMSICLFKVRKLLDYVGILDQCDSNEMFHDLEDSNVT